MAPRVAHKFNCPVADLMVEGQVSPDDWNEDHDLVAIGPSLLGVGEYMSGEELPVEEITVGFGLDLIPGEEYANPTLDLNYADQAEAEAGVDAVKVMTALRVAEAIAAQGGGSDGGGATTVNGLMVASWF